MFLFLPLLCLADINVDPRTSDIVVDVKAISITSTDNTFDHGITVPSLMKMANDLRAEYPQSMRFDQIQEITDAITLFLRDKGYKFHYAFIPPQKNNGGIVTISIIEVQLNDVYVINDSYFPDKKISRLFQHLLHKPLYQPDVDRILRALQNNHAIHAFAYYSRGSKPQSIRLNIKVSAKPRGSIGLSLDNHGASGSGKNRALMQLSWRNPLKRFDSVSAGLLQSYGEAKNNYGYFFYETALFNLYHELDIYASNSAFEVGGDFSSLGLEGDASLVEFRYTNHFFYGEKTHQSLSVSYSDKANDFTSAFHDEAAEPDEEATSVGVSWSVDYLGKQSSQKVQTRFYSGEFTLNGQNEALRFDRLILDYQYYRRFSLGASMFAFESTIRSLFSDQRLPSFERMSLTGSAGVRAFEAGQFSADKANSVAIALHLPTYRLGHAERGLFSLHSRLFTEWASGTQYDFDGEQVNDLTLSSMGLAFGGRWGDHVSVNMVLAAPIGSDPDVSDTFLMQPFSMSLTVKR